MKEQTIIHKAKLKKGVDLIVEYTSNSASGAAIINQQCKQPVHKDLIDAFQKLSVHLARLTDQYDKSGQESDRISFRGFSIRGEDDKEGVVLTGIRIVGNNKSLILNSPFQRFGEEGEDVGYEFIQDLVDDLHLAKEEVLAYLYDGKFAPNAQLELFDKNESKIDEGDEDDDDDDSGYDD